MPPAVAGVPTGAGIIFGVFWFLFMLGMIAAYVIMLIAMWKLMKAHEKIADKLSEIADKFQSK